MWVYKTDRVSNQCAERIMHYNTLYMHIKMIFFIMYHVINRWFDQK